MAAWETGLAPRHGLVVQGHPVGLAPGTWVSLKACPKHQVTSTKMHQPPQMAYSAQQVNLI